MSGRILFFTLIFIGSLANAFEIKPICPPLKYDRWGAYCKAANTSEVEYRETSMECENTRDYAIQGRNQPIHEAITRQAYERVFGQKLATRNFSTALLSGVEWNDDPQQLIRKLLYGKGVSNIRRFAGIMDEQEPRDSITIRGHYGDMQFLHAMRPEGKENASPDEIKQLIYDWIKNTYAVARGDTPYNTLISRSYYAAYFTEQQVCCDISDLFDPRKMLVPEGSYARVVQLLASGSILHIIQDSYSRSHTRRDAAGRLEEFYQYSNESHDHCLSDAGFNENRPSIEQAIEASAAYMRLKDKNADWCREMAPFIKQVFSAGAVHDDSCDSPGAATSAGLSQR